MAPEHIFGLSDTGYGLLIVASVIGVLFGAIFLIGFLFYLRDCALMVMCDSKENWIVRILAFPCWILLFCVCLVFTIISMLLMFGAISDARDWWHKGKK